MIRYSPLERERFVSNELTETHFTEQCNFYIDGSKLYRTGLLVRWSHGDASIIISILTLHKNLKIATVTETARLKMLSVKYKPYSRYFIWPLDVNLLQKKWVITILTLLQD